MAGERREQGGFVVETDLYIARRKRLHAVTNSDGKSVFHAPHVLQVLDFLTDNDIRQAVFTDDDTRYLVSFERIISPTT